MSRHTWIVVTLAVTLLGARASQAWEHKSSRSFRTSDSPARASQVVSNMRVSDAARFGSLPPGVSASRTGPGHFAARSPIASVRADVSVRSDGRGGSIVTETTRSRSILPCAAAATSAIHGAATSVQQAYSRAAARTPPPRAPRRPIAPASFHLRRLFAGAR